MQDETGEPIGESAGGDDNMNESMENGMQVDHDQEMADGAEPVENGTVAPPASGQLGERQPNKVRVTTPYLTKYERARVLGTRALQIRCVRDASLLFFLGQRITEWS